jgi:KDO2-lipid IV(A) lauroyltransferase
MPGRRKISKLLKHVAYSSIARVFVCFINRVKLESGLRIGEVLGLLLYLLDAKGRERAIKNLMSSFPGKSSKEIRRTAKLCYINMGRNMAEFSRFARPNRSELLNLVRIEGRENLDRALALGKGVLLMSAHFGNWELLGGVLAAKGYKVNAIVRNLRIESLNRLVNELRTAAGFRPIPREKGLKSALRSLRGNQILAILADIDTSSEGVFVDFFGRPAYTPSGPVLISLKTGAPIVPAFIIREGSRNHRVVIGEPLRITGDVKRDTQTFTRIVEVFVRRYPYQWIWMHRRWRED